MRSDEVLALLVLGREVLAERVDVVGREAVVGRDVVVGRVVVVADLVLTPGRLVLPPVFLPLTLALPFLGVLFCGVR